MSVPPLSERTIQDALYREYARRKHEPIVPNAYHFGTWESDLLTVTTAGYVNEFEIKISTSDYRADREGSRAKQLKHLQLAEPSRAGNIPGRQRIPNYFWYVTPAGLIDPTEIPDYAGHMEVVDVTLRGRPRRYLDTRRPAPRLHTTKIGDAQLRGLYRCLFYRYWSARTRRIAA